MKKEKKSSTSIAEAEMEVDDEEDDDDEEEEVDTTTLRGKRNHPLILAMWSLVDYIRDLKNDADQTLIDPFVRLPSKRIYPDYYEEIKQPISFNVIKSKLNKRLYTSLNDLNRDFNLLFTNAMQYNVEDSVIYNNAKQLMQAFIEKSAQLAMSDVGNLVFSKHGDENESGGATSKATNLPNGLTPSKKRISTCNNDSKASVTPPKKIHNFSVGLFFLIK